MAVRLRAADRPEQGARAPVPRRSLREKRGVQGRSRDARDRGRGHFSLFPFISLSLLTFISAYSKQDLAKPRIESSVLYMARPTPAPSNSWTVCTDSGPPPAGLKDSVSVPGPGMATSVARYWSPYAWRPTTMGRVQPGTRRGTLDMMMGSF